MKKNERFGVVGRKRFSPAYRPVGRGIGRLPATYVDCPDHQDVGGIYLRQCPTCFAWFNDRPVKQPAKAGIQ